MERLRPRQAEIYKIVCVPTGKCYVGHTARGSALRFSQHLYELERGNHPSIYLQNAWNKYGPSAFSFEVIEVCQLADRLVREQFWMDTLGAHFNMAKVAGSMLGTKRSKKVRKHLRDIAVKNENWKRGYSALVKLWGTPEFSKKLSEQRKADQTVLNCRTPEAVARHKEVVQSPEYRARMSARMKGRVISAETRAKMSAARKLRPYKPLSEEHKRKVGLFHKGKKHTPEHQAKITEGLKRAWARRKGLLNPTSQR